MLNKKIPMRMCVVSHERLPKKDLIRVVKFNDTISVDLTGKQNGKGCYLKKDASVIETARKTKALNRVFECEVEDSVYDEILKSIE